MWLRHPVFYVQCLLYDWTRDNKSYAFSPAHYFSKLILHLPFHITFPHSRGRNFTADIVPMTTWYRHITDYSEVSHMNSFHSTNIFTPCTSQECFLYVLIWTYMFILTHRMKWNHDKLNDNIIIHISLQIMHCKVSYHIGLLP